MKREGVKRTLKWWAISFSILIFIAAVVTVGVLNIMEGDTNKASVVQLKNEIPADFQGVHLKINLTKVEGMAYRFTARFLIQPVGKDYAIEGGSRARMAKKGELIIEDKTVKLEEGKSLPFQDVKITFSDGQVNAYPFDEYLGTISVTGTTSPPSGASGSDSEPQPLPIFPTFVGAVRGWKIQAIMEDIGAEDGAPYTQTLIMFTASRSWTTVVFSIFIFITMWMLSLAVTGLTLSLFIKKQKVALTFLRMSIAILFAITGMRNTQPDVPPIGSTLDTVGYFWNVLIIALSVIALLIKYNYQEHRLAKKRESENETKQDDLSEIDHMSTSTTSLYHHQDTNNTRFRIKSKGN